MCGIAGFFSVNTLQPEEKNYLNSMIEILHHRGPDGYGHHFDNEKGIAMAHARLSIIDLEGGHQPLYSTTNDNVLTVNGEFYDYKRLRTNLRLWGFDFRTKSDSEIALYLYDKFGLDFLEHLRGEFAFALFDEKNDRLIMVRDRYGIRPIFYYHDDDHFYYASEVKSLFTHPGIPREFDPKALWHQLMHTMVPGTSAYKGIRAIEPGCMLIVDRKDGRINIQEKKYWDIDFPRKGDRDTSKGAQYHIEKVQEMLTEAVRFRLEADVPVGCYLSGGIDSCSMLGLSSSMQQSPVKAYTISFDHDEYDEAAIAREMAAKTKADQEMLNLKADDLYGENYINTVWHAERTFYNTLGVAKYCMSRRVNESGYRVVVTGEGADEQFAGYPFFKRDMLRLGTEYGTEEERESYRALMERTNAVFKGAILSQDQVSHPAWDEVCGFTPSWIQPWMKTCEISRELLHPDIQEELKDYDPIAEIAYAMDKNMINGRHFLDIVQYTWSKTMLECQILNWGGDRVDMAHSMESRPAFLDHHLAEAAWQVPPHLRINGNIEKWVLREAMKNILPEVLYKREKFAFMAPPGHTGESKQEKLNMLFEEYLSGEALDEAGVLDTAKVRQFLDDYEQDTERTSLVRKDALINHLLGLQILHKHFIEKHAEALGEQDKA